MRKHLYDGFKRGQLLPFPLLKTRRGGSKVKFAETFSVYCLSVQDAGSTRQRYG